MAVEVFSWIPDDEAQREGEFRTRSARFGDGYEQVSGDGLNPEQETWTLTFGGMADEVEPILAFVRRHGGWKSFIWTNPRGALGLFRCAGYRDQNKPGGVVSLSITFTQAFAP